MISNFFTRPSFLYSNYGEKNKQHKCSDNDKNDDDIKEKDISDTRLYEWKWSKHTNQMNQKSKKRRNKYNNASHEHFIHDFNRFNRFEQNEQNDKIQAETNEYIDEYKTIDTPKLRKQNKQKNNEDDVYAFKYKFTRDNDKEKINEKQSRISLIQTNINPYLKKNKYIDDIKIQDNYLRPMNSNMELQ